MTFPFLRFGIFLSLLFAAAFTVLAQDPEASVEEAAPPPKIRFRQYFIPDARKSELTRGYLPLGREKFQELLDDVRRKSQSEQHQVYLLGGRYYARLQGNVLRDGFAFWEFHNPSSTPTSTQIAPLELAIGQAVWQLPDRAPASMGVDAAGRSWIVVPQSGRLILPWSLRGVRDEKGNVRFRFQVPSCPTNQLLLALPRGMRPVTGQGLVSRATPNVDQWEGLPEAQGFIAAASQGQEMDHWIINFGGNTDLTFSIEADADDSENASFIAVRQSDQYSFLPSRLELTSEIQFDVYHQPADGLRIDTGADLELLEARLGDESIAWTREKQDGDEQTGYQLQFPRSLLGPNQVVRLVFHAPLKLDQLWPLPRIHCKDVFWQEGRGELFIPGIFELRRLDPIRCQQTKVTSLPQSGESLSLQGHVSDFAIQVHLAHRPPGLAVAKGTSLRLDAEVVTGRVTAELRATWGELFTLRADVPRPWTVDRIEAEPAAALDTASGAWRLNNGVLEISLRRPVTVDQPLRLKIEGHRVAPSDGLTLDGMEFIRFENTEAERAIVQLHASAPLQVALRGDLGLTRLDPRELSVSEQLLISSDVQGVLFRREAASSELAAYLIQDEPRYLADTQVELRLEKGKWTESYRIVCTPESLPVRYLRLRMSEARSKPVQWYLGEQVEPLTVTLVESQGRDDASEVVGEYWEIELPEPQSMPFQIRGERVFESTEAVAVALASLPQAVSESGRLVVRSDTAIHIENEGLEPLPVGVTESNVRARTRGVFRYQPSRTDRVTVAVAENVNTASAWVWSAQYTTYLMTDRPALHEATFRLQNIDASVVTCVLPRTYGSIELLIDGRTVEMGDIHNGKMEIRLPAGQEFPTVSLRHTEPIRRAAWGTQLASEFARLELPVAHAQYAVYTSPDELVWSPRRGSLTPSDPHASIRRRLFDPLLRPKSSAAEAEPYTWTGSTPLPETLTQLLETRLPDEAPPTWLETVRLLESASRPFQWHLDVHALAALGIAPDAPLGFDASALRASELLNVAGLRLLFVDRHIVLTSSESLAVYATQLAGGPQVPSRLAVAPLDGNGWFAALVRNASSQAGLITMDEWQGWWQRYASHWPSGNVDEAPLHTGGTWRRTAFQIDPAAPRTYEIYAFSRQLLSLGAWACLLFSVALGWWAIRRVPVLWPLVIAIFAATAMLLPDLLITWGANLTLGGLASSVFFLIRRTPTVRSAGGSDSSSVHRSARIAGAAVVLTAACVLAQEPDAPAPRELPTRPQEFRVLVPVDENREPAGNYVYVPRTLYNFIHLAADREPYEWLLQRAHYTATVTPSSVADSLTVPGITATFQVESFVPNQLVRIPLRRDELQIVDAKVNGQPAEVRWGTQEDELLVHLAQPRVHEIVLALNSRKLNPDYILNIAIPPVAHSTLTLRGVPSGLELQTSSALGASHRTDAGIEVALGPVSQITLPHASMPSTSAAARLAVEESAWLRVRPNGTVLDVKLRVESPAGPLESLTLLADSRLRLLPLPASEPVDGEPSVRPGDFQQLRFALKEGTGQRFSLQFSFLVTNTTGVGRVRLPRFEVLGANTVQRYIAISHAPGLALSGVTTSGLTEISTDRFMEFWGRDDEQPMTCYEIASGARRGDLDWTAQSQFVPSVRESQQRLILRAQRQQLRVAFDAVLSCSGGPIFQHRVRIPAGFIVDDLSVWESDAEIPVRYTRSGSDELTVFLPSAAASRQRVLIDGRLPISTAEPIALPQIHFVQADISRRQLEIWRDSDVKEVELAEMDAWQPVDAHLTDGTWIGSWQGTGPLPTDAPGRMTVRPNDRQARGFLATRLQRSPQGWMAEAEYHLSVERGVYDAIRLEVPSEWKEPLELEPAYPFELRPLPGLNRQHLIIRPAQPVTSATSVRIRGALETAEDRFRRVPDIVPLDVIDFERFLVLPTRIESQQVSWATSGLQVRPLPGIFRMSGQVTGAWDSYWIVGNRFHAVIRNVERAAGIAQVRLADIFVQWDGRRYSGVASFDVEPGGKTSCRLMAPPGVRVNYVSLDGIPALLEPDEEGWTIRLGTPQLPQRLEVLFEGGIQSGVPRRFEFAVPWCADLPVARTFWTVRYPWSFGELRADRAATRQTAIAQDRARLESLVGLVNGALDMAAETGASESEQWLRPWADRIGAARIRLAQYRERASDDERQEITAVLESLQQAWDAQASRIAPATLDRMLRHQDVTVADLNTAWRAARGSYQRVVSMSLPGAAASVTLETPPSSHPLLYQWVVAGLFLAAGLATVLGIRRGLTFELWREHPQALLALLGVAWSLWLTPPLIGWLLMALAVMASFYSAWPTAMAPRRF